jgi:hypothetical protein
MTACYYSPALSFVLPRGEARTIDTSPAATREGRGGRREAPEVALQDKDAALYSVASDYFREARCDTRIPTTFSRRHMRRHALVRLAQSM